MVLPAHHMYLEAAPRIPQDAKRSDLDGNLRHQYFLAVTHFLRRSFICSHHHFPVVQVDHLEALLRRIERYLNGRLPSDCALNVTSHPLPPNSEHASHLCLHILALKAFRMAAIKKMFSQFTHPWDSIRAQVRPDSHHLHECQHYLKNHHDAILSAARVKRRMKVQYKTVNASNLTYSSNLRIFLSVRPYCLVLFSRHHHYVCVHIMLSTF